MWLNQSKKFLNKIIKWEWIILASKIKTHKDAKNNNIEVQAMLAKSRKVKNLLFYKYL